jgi:hypothetical protein
MSIYSSKEREREREKCMKSGKECHFLLITTLFCTKFEKCFI